MMKRITIFALLFAALSGSAFGQTPPGAYTSPAASSGGGGITQVTVLPGSCTATSSPVQLTVAPYGIYVPSFIGGVCSYVLSSQISGPVAAASFGVKSDWQVESTGANFTVTNGSPTVTCTTCAFTAAEFTTPKACFFSNWNGSDSTYASASAGPLTATTCTFVNATTVTMSNNANLNAGTTNGNVGVFAWGHDDNAAWQLSKTAAYDGINCQTIQFGGISNWTAAFGLTAACRGISGGSTVSKYPGVTGYGVGAGATILLPPWFSGTGCTGGASGGACTGLGEWSNVSFNTLGQANNITINKNFFETFIDGSYQHLALWGGWASTGSGMVLNAGCHVVIDITVDGFGIPLTNNANDAQMFSSFFGNGKSNAGPIVNNGLLVTYSIAYPVGAASGIGVQNNGTYIAYQDVCISQAVGSTCINAATGSKTYIHGSLMVNSVTTTSVAILTAGTAYVYVDTSSLGGGATGTAWSCVATSTCEAGPGNTYNANPIGVIGCAVNSVSPAACAGNRTGAFVVPISTTSYTVNTTAVTANSVILLTPRTYTGNLPGTPTCVAPAVTSAPVVSAIVAATSFTITIPTIASQTCWNYEVRNL